MMYKHILILIALMLPLAAGAVIYKSVDRDGNVVYTDESSSNAEIIPDPTPNTVTMPKPETEAATPKSEAAEETIYTSLRVVSPAAEETIRSNPGILAIVLDLKPKLDNKAGHSISVLVDGYVLIKRSNQLSMQIPDINRGTHHVQAVVSDKQGKTLIKSANVQFFMQRQSILNKPGASRVGPLDSAGNPVRPGPQGTYFQPGPVRIPAEASGDS